jgi:hypothetical protein
MTASIIDVTLVDPLTLRPLIGGSDATSFAFALPAGARCPADSASGGVRLSSFMIPASVDLAHVRFDAAGPAEGFPLFDHGHPFVGANTALETGLVVGLPAFDLATMVGLSLPAGGYQVGVACTAGGALRTAWSSVIEVGPDVVGGRPHVSWRVAPRSSALATADAQTSSVTSVRQPAVTAGAVSAVTNPVVADTAPLSVQPVVAEVVSVAMPAAGPTSATEWSAGWSAALVVAVLVVTCAWRVVIRRRSV